MSRDIETIEREKLLERSLWREPHFPAQHVFYKDSKSVITKKDHKRSFLLFWGFSASWENESGRLPQTRTSSFFHSFTVHGARLSFQIHVG